MATLFVEEQFEACGFIIPIEYKHGDMIIINQVNRMEAFDKLDKELWSAQEDDSYSYHECLEIGALRVALLKLLNCPNVYKRKIFWREETVTE